MNIKTLKEFLSAGIAIQKGDYLYQHDKEGALYNDIDFSKLYFIEEVSENGLEIHGYFSDEIKNVQLKELEGFWWVCRFYPGEKRALQIK